MQKTKLVCLVLSTLPVACWSVEQQAPEVVINAPRLTNGSVSKLTTSDTAAVLASQPGLSVYSAGGVSGLPALRGLADDRIKIMVDGMDATAACGNHMNSPLSYIDPQQVATTQVLAGITSVVQGGDNIAGVIQVKSAKPMFAKTGQGLLTSGQASVQSRSVDKGVSSSLSATVASEQFSLNYSGATTKADSYQDGHGNKVLDTLYKSTNQSVTAAAQGSGHLWVLKLGEQLIPYQGFANQYMDMTHNRGLTASLRYEGQYNWGKLEGQIDAQNTRHEMGFFSAERTGTMPMNTYGRDRGYVIKAELPRGEDTVRIGHEYHAFTLDDWWPPVSGSMMMAPNTYVNINNGQRDRVALFGEWERQVNAQWSAVLGMRDELVRTNADQVQDYGCGMMCGTDTAAASSFNAKDKRKQDNNVDLSLLTRYEASATNSYEFGAARKTRSPNLYERYSWGRGTMAMTMIGWYGDANGYVGNMDLKPEVANTLSATADWHDAGSSVWGIRLTPFVTYVQDYIDADQIGTYHPYSNTSETKALLQFANHDAYLYGFNLSGQATAWQSAAWGEGVVKGKLDWTRGRRADGGALYHIMPPNLTVTGEQKVGNWTHYLEWMLVASKTQVDARRYEDSTAGYALFNLGTRYQLPYGISIQAGVRNLFDKAYALPLGGANLAEFKTAGSSQINPVYGQGRSIDLGLSVKF
jgi:iron complex outermembrane receptor protein